MINEIRLALLDEATISTLVTDRVFVSAAPATATLPRLVLHQIGSDEANCVDDSSGSLRHIEIDIDAEGATAQDAFTLAAAVRAFLKDFTGTAGTITVLSTVIDDIHERAVAKTTQPGQTRQYIVATPTTFAYRP